VKLRVLRYIKKVYPRLRSTLLRVAHAYVPYDMCREIVATFAVKSKDHGAHESARGTDIA
jgi:hypothetical protein